MNDLVKKLPIKKKTKNRINNILITTNTNLIRDLDINENQCCNLENYPLSHCYQCKKYIHISLIIANYGLCYECDDKLYKQYNYNSDLVKKNRKRINLDKYHCQKCKLIDQTLPGSTLFFSKIGNHYLNYCNNCLVN